MEEKTGTLVAQLVRQLTVTLKQLLIYSSDHPSVREPLGRLHDTFQRLLPSCTSISFSETEGRLLVDGEPYQSKDPAATRLVSALRGSGIGILTFSRGLTSGHLEWFLRLMAQKPSALEARGGMAAALEQEGISAIKVERVKYGRIPSEVERLEDAVIMDFLQGKGREADIARSRDGLRKAPERLAALALRVMIPKEEGGLSDTGLDVARLRGIYERLERDLFHGQPEEWRELKRKIAYSLLMNHPILKAELSKFQDDFASGFEALGKTLTPSLYKGVAAHLISTAYLKGLGTSEEIREVMGLLVPDLEEQKELLEVLKARSGEWGLDEEKFRLLEEQVRWGSMSLEERVEALRDSTWADQRTFPRAKELLVALFEQGRFAEVSEIVESFGVALSEAVPAERPRYVGEAQELMNVLVAYDSGKTIRQRLLSQLLDGFKEEGDQEAAGQLLTALLDMAAGLVRGGRADEGCSFFSLLLDQAVSTTDWESELLRQRISEPSAKECLLCLVDILGSPGGPSWSQVERTMGSIAEQAAPILMERLVAEQDTASRARLLKLLSGMGDVAVKAALPFANDPRWFVVRNVACILGQARQTVDEEVIGAMLRHAEPRVRKEAVRTLMAVGQAEGIRFLLPLINDPDQGVQQLCLEGLASSGRAECIEPLLRIVSLAGGTAALSEANRIMAIQALGKAHCKEAVAALVALVQEKGALRYKESQELRLSAVAALGHIGGEAAVGGLKAVSRDILRCERPVREAAERALAEARRAHD